MGTRRIVILSIHELTERFQVDLEDHLNGSISQTVVREFVESILDFYCFNVIEGSGRIQTDLLRIGVDKDVVDEVSVRLSSTLLKLIQKGFEIIYPNRFYSYQWRGPSDLAVEENFFKTVSRQTEPEEEDT